MTQLLHAAIEEALKQTPDVQKTIATAMFEQMSKLREKRPIGLAEGQVRVPDDFNEPLSNEELEAWYGDNPDDPLNSFK